MIDEKLADEFVNRFIQVTGGKWTNIYSEIQDDGTELLLIVKAPQWEVGELSSTFRKTVADALNELIPIQPENPVGNWTIGFEHEENIYDSILANGV